VAVTPSRRMSTALVSGAWNTTLSSLASPHVELTSPLASPCTCITMCAPPLATDAPQAMHLCTGGFRCFRCHRRQS